MAEPLQPLRGTRVLDLSRYLPGPYLSRILSDLGADVVMVEGPGGDPARRLPPIGEEGGSFFAALNWGKRSVGIDLKREAGCELLLTLVRSADVLIESFRPGVLDRLGLGRDRLTAENAGLILCSISGYGQESGLRGRAGHDLNYLARAGVLGLFGPPDRSPTVPGVQIADLAGGALHGAVGVLAALLERQQTGTGRHLDISMTRNSLALAAVEYVRQQDGPAEGRGAGFLTGGLACYRVYATKDDRFMTLAALEPKFFATFCNRAGCEHLVDAGLLSGAAGQRVAQELESLFAQRTQAEWVELLGDSDCCCEPVRSLAEAAQDPDLGVVGFRAGGHHRIVPDFGAPPVLASERRVPGLGEDNEAVLAELGVDASLEKRAKVAGALLSANREEAG